MRQTLSLLGSTGSVGRQTLDVAEKLGFDIAAICADKSLEPIELQARKFSPRLVALYNENAARDLRVRLADTDIRVVSGIGGLTEAACLPETDTVVAAEAGTIGLLPVTQAIRQGKRIAIANKELLVCAGAIIKKEAAVSGAKIIPVDSEHSAIFQCLIGREHSSVKHLLLTASGGPFRGMSFEELESVAPAQALRHPNWHMGPKITIDCATLMNKGLELIEAMHLFNMAPEDIRVLIHPQSVVHSMVQFADNSVMAQLAVKDMRLPIQYALTYPECLPSACAEELDFFSLSALTFEEPDLKAFPCLELARRTAGRRDAACAVMNAANEEAVMMFIGGRIGFNDIYRLTAEAVERFGASSADSIEEILAVDAQTRSYILGKV